MSDLTKRFQEVKNKYLTALGVFQEKKRERDKIEALLISKLKVNSIAEVKGKIEALKKESDSLKIKLSDHLDKVEESVNVFNNKVKGVDDGDIIEDSV